MDLVTLGVVCADVMVRPVDAMPERGKLTLVPQLELHVGGLAGVTASVYCQLGGKAGFIGKLARDGFGDYIANTLKANGVDVSHVAYSDSERTSATVVLISADGERTFLHHLGANAVIDESDVDFDYVASAKVFHWGGPAITPMLDGAPMGRLFARARELGVKTSMDTCYDGKGTWLPNIEPALPHLDVVMSSLEEARMYTGKQEPEDIADFYRSYGVETVMVKLGENGLFVKNSTEAHRIAAHKVPVVDTTGAGDASCAGFLYGLNNGWSLLDSGRLANAVGGLTVQAMGGAEAITSLEETVAFMKRA